MNSRSPLSRRRWPLLALALAALPVLAAVTERYYFELPLEDETSLDARFDLALGRVEVGKAEAGYLFQAEVALEDEQMVPGLDYRREGRDGRLTLGFESGTKGKPGLTVRGFRAPEDNEWLLFFSDRIPLRLAFELGMADAELDFGGLQVQRLHVESGMATTRLAFSTPNGVVMEELEISAGMARFQGQRLGNARFERLSFEGGAGAFDLDFSGAALPPGARADLKVGMASLSVVLPERTPVVLRAPESWLARVEIPNDYVKRGKGLWHSEFVRDEAAAFVVNIEAGMGKVTLHTATAGD